MRCRTRYGWVNFIMFAVNYYTLFPEYKNYLS
jgi:hypothetical protein